MKNKSIVKNICLNNENVHKLTFRFIKNLVLQYSLNISFDQVSIINPSLSKQFIFNSIFIPFLNSLDDLSLDSVIKTTTLSRNYSKIILNSNGVILKNILLEIEYFPPS